MTKEDLRAFPPEGAANASPLQQNEVEEDFEAMETLASQLAPSLVVSSDGGKVRGYSRPQLKDQKHGGSQALVVVSPLSLFGIQIWYPK